MAIKDEFLNKLKYMVDEIKERYAKKSDISTYSVVKKQTAEAGYAASYTLMKDGVQAGDTINIPKDYLVKDTDVKVCAQEGVPVEGLQPGDKYIDFIVNTVNGDGNESHLYLALKDIVAGYTAGNGIAVSASNEISVKVDTANANGLSADADGLKMSLASAEKAGAMSAADKQRLDNALTEQDISAITKQDIINLFDGQEENAAAE